TLWSGQPGGDGQTLPQRDGLNPRCKRTMAEPQEPREGTAGQPPVPPIQFDLPEDNRLGGAAELSDDAPTIISKPAQSPARREEAFPQTWRGRKLAHFERIEPIGVGGMAAVIRARDCQLDRCVALKILPPEMAADTENVRRFHQEARAAAKL